MVRRIVGPRIQEEQCGFRPGCGTLDQLYNLSRVRRVHGSSSNQSTCVLWTLRRNKSFHCQGPQHALGNVNTSRVGVRQRGTSYMLTGLSKVYVFIPQVSMVKINKQKIIFKQTKILIRNKVFN
ncbi:hypothetical protein GOODEAATRI_022379 [Goodea atripinnis]|uniref:Reverse transcriptase domain-containing protein n=1 Tax=Goodea atripinnis TaxID=208336 RepID=A0ABV0MVQ7_9TELE